MADPAIDVESTEVALVPPDPLGAPVGRHPLQPVPTLPPVSPERVFDGLSLHALTAEQRALLLARVDPATLDVLPTGEVYLPQVQYRRILNQAFGPGAWGMMPLGDPSKQDNTIIQRFALFVAGKCVAVALGEQAYYPHGRMTWATAWEAAKSNALMRCAKDLGVASECWDRTFTRAFQDSFCIQVWVKIRKRGEPERTEAQWRRQDAPALRDECGYVATDGRPQDGGRFGPAPRRRAPRTAAEPTDDGNPAADDLAAQLRASLGADGGDPDTPREPGEDRDTPPPVPVPISAAQRAKLYASCRRCGVSNDALHAALAKKGVHSVNDIPADRFAAVLAWIEAGGKNPQKQ